MYRYRSLFSHHTTGWGGLRRLEGALHLLLFLASPYKTTPATVTP
jgi:hypothetical protein